MQKANPTGNIIMGRQHAARDIPSPHSTVAPRPPPSMMRKKAVSATSAPNTKTVVECVYGTMVLNSTEEGLNAKTNK